MADFIAILDFGSQYTQLIARRVREHRVYCEILKHDTSAAEIRERGIRGIILSGGPSSAYADESPKCDPEIFHIGVPILGICYGMQLACQVLGGKVVPATSSHEYGATKIDLEPGDPLFDGLSTETSVWMSHGDRVDPDPDSFETLAKSSNCPHAAIRHRATGFRGLQFHPEVTHTPHGREIIRNFLWKICGCEGTWSLAKFTEEKIRELREQIGDRHVVCGLSGGVDSSVVSILLHKAIGDQLHCIFVDNGVLRTGERDQVVETFGKHYHLDLRVADSRDLFLTKLKDVSDPEEKRKIIGHTFIDVFKSEAETLGQIDFLAQGTLYPDVIESVSPFGPAVTIKSHHNVGGLPEELGFELVEPLKFLFKDEVRIIGRELGLPDSLIDRQPFPGPGLAIRILGKITEDRLSILRRADSIVQEEMESFDKYRDVWQSFAVLLPIQTVGVMGDKRTYEYVIALRVVESKDGMTANWVYLPQELLATISNRICNEVKGVNRVVLDISSKPPSTIEWE